MIISKKYIIIFSAVLLLLIILVFADAGFHSSNSNSDSSISSYSVREPENPISRSIILYVHNDDCSFPMLEKELTDNFEENGYSVTLTDAIREDYGSQFIFVNVMDKSVSYTPVYSTSDTNVLFGFSYTGKTRHLDITGSAGSGPVTFSSEDTNGYQLLMRGNIDLKDETKGFFTYRNYQNHLAKEISSVVVSSIDSQLLSRGLKV